MKETVVNLKESSAGTRDECSEEKCINCFANGGCMHEHLHIENFYELRYGVPERQIQTGKYNYKAITA